MTPPEEPGLDPGEETRRKFREALERKHAAAGAHVAGRGGNGPQVKDSNDKRQRQFRRRSG